MQIPSFSNTIIQWYNQNKRDLPWRNNKDPYSIWLSEIILQQTKVAQGTPYFLKFIENFPDVLSLSKAKEEEILRLWQGLGYYSRARNLHKCAKILVEEYNGIFPSDYKTLLKLPGIGKYTAAAIASIGFDAPVPVVDGNVYRVLSRIFGMFDDISNVSTFKLFFNLSQDLLHPKASGAYNQAVMELGALICHPVAPQCEECPFHNQCFALNENKIQLLPVKTKKVKKRSKTIYYIVLKWNNQIALTIRDQDGIWKNLYEFISMETTKEPDEIDLLDHLKTLFHGLPSIHSIGPIGANMQKHILTHRIIYANFIEIELNSTNAVAFKDNKFQWYGIEKADELPKPILIHNYLNEHFF